MTTDRDDPRQRKILVMPRARQRLLLGVAALFVLAIGFGVIASWDRASRIHLTNGTSIPLTGVVLTCGGRAETFERIEPR